MFEGQLFREWSLPRHSVMATAINIIANNIGDVNDEYLDVVPVRLQWRIWRVLEARGLCLHAWRLFSRRLLREDNDKTLGLHRFRQHICRPTDELSRYTQPMTSLPVDFITHLVISGGCDFTTNQMLCLADVKNLGVLELIQPADTTGAAFPNISDRLLRGWTEMEKPFPLLRVLRIWGDRHTTQESLRWVSKFPSLFLLGGYWCSA
ncbi:hypothetical protein CDD83_2622 [Cordyceps sp. RAO-2017]|nr:hypothetical protein CDD83_2622 [Cordyceps sp. RAO-2017]